MDEATSNDSTARPRVVVVVSEREPAGAVATASPTAPDEAAEAPTASMPSPAISSPLNRTR